MQMNSRRLTALLFMVLAFAGFRFATAQAATYTGTVNKDKVFFRAAANTDSIYHAVLDKGTRVTITGIRGDFYRVEYKNIKGYIMKSLVNAPSAADRAFGGNGESGAQTEPETDSAGTKGSAYSGTVNKDKVFFRAAANTDSMYHAVLSKGTQVGIIGVRGDFYKVEYKNITGYIMKSLVNASSAAKEAFGGGETAVKGKYSDVSSVSGLGGAPSPTRKGSYGDSVEKLQRALQIKGHLKGAADGKYGDITAGAVRAYQRSAGLSVTGEANSATIARLFGQGTGGEEPAKDDPNMKGITSISKIDVPNTTRPGNTGKHVKALQQALKLKGYYKAGIDSSYGELTTEAVKRFQRATGLSADGVAGNNTIRKLFGKDAANHSTQTEKLNWFAEGTRAIPKGATFTVKDVSSGLTFQARRWSGANHLDAEPLGRSDAATLKRISDGAYSWARRSILVKYDGHVYAASMNTMPHEQDTIEGNNYDGHFCIHFYKSRTHGTNRVDAAHQNAVDRAMRSSW